MDEIYKGYNIKIEQDELGESPREWDNLSTMAFFHGGYNLGDKDHGFDTKDYPGWVELEGAIIRKHKPVCIAPVYLYDHSGITIKIGSFSGYLPEGHAEFDSGMIGYVFIPSKQVRKEWKVKHISKKIKEICIKNREAEIKTYDQFLRGDVYGYSINDLDDGSCWGFYGYDECLKEAKDKIDHHIKSKPAGVMV